ncbi:MAG TPA: 6-phosphogluconolactonase [Candidatus Nanoarchaeia archaeon]|nr:6-phosphogluconolactonase [Candidatus Nanoarchaeia archaeon]
MLVRQLFIGKEKMIETYCSKNKNALYEKAACIISKSLRESLKSKEFAALGLCGGRNVEDIYSMLSSKRLRWDKIHTFLTDERVFEKTNSKLIEKHFGSLSHKNLHLYRNSIEDYRNQLSDIGNLFDFLVLSAGEDGHIASIFPNHSSVLDNGENYILVQNSPKLPSTRISISRNIVKSASAGMLLFIGEEEKQAYSNFINEKVSEEECPAKIARRINRLYVLTDLL